MLHCAIYVFFAKGCVTVPTSLHIHPQNYSSLALIKTNGDVNFFFGSIFLFQTMEHKGAIIQVDHITVCELTYSSPIDESTISGMISKSLRRHSTIRPLENSPLCLQLVKA